MEGVNILATITNDTVNWSFALFLTGTIIFMVLGLSNYDIFLGKLLMGLSVLCFICIFVFSMEEEVIYKATIDDTVPLKSIEEKYIIVDKVDDLYTLKLKENEDE